MKRCPACQRTYVDETLNYCLDDGASLVYGPVATEPATAVISPGQATSEDPTRTFAPGDDSVRYTPSTSTTLRWPTFAGLIAVLLIGGGYLAYRYLPSSGSQQIESLAVMPFVNSTGDADIEYLSDGLTESLINSLSQIPKLSVKARSSVFTYKGREVSPQQLAKDLSVQAILNGRVSQRGDQLIMSVELMDARTGNQIWGEQYFRKTAEVVSLQSEIARDISNKLRQKLTGADQQRIAKRGTDDPEAYELYLKGRFHWNKRTIADINKSIEYFQQAISKDPAYSLAYAGLADGYALIPSYALNTSNDAYPKARTAALKALELDESLAEAHATLATVLYEFDWKFAEAENEFKRSVELNPNYATAHHWYAEYLLSMGRRDEALTEIKRAQECDPLSLIINGIVGVVHSVRGEHDLAIAQLKKTVEMEPNFVRAHLFLADAYMAAGKFDEAITEYEKLYVMIGDPPDVASRGWDKVRAAYKTSGEKGFWEQMVRFGEEQRASKRNASPPLIVMAGIHAQAGNKDRAFEYLERSFQEREPDLLRLNGPFMDPLRSDPRFQDILRRIGLPQ